MVLYNHDSNTILADPLTSRNERKLVRATCVLHAYLSDCSFTPKYQMLDNECPYGLKTFLRESSVKFQLVPHTFITPTLQNEQSKLTRMTTSSA